MHCAFWRLCSLTNSPIVKYPLNWGWCAWSTKGSLKHWPPNGELLLLSLTKCDGVPCSLPSRITTKVLKNCKTFSSRPRPRPNVQDQDQDFHFCPRGTSRPRPWSQGLHHCFLVLSVLELGSMYATDRQTSDKSRQHCYIVLLYRPSEQTAYFVSVKASCWEIRYKIVLPVGFSASLHKMAD